MKYILFCFIVLLGLLACQDDDNGNFGLMLSRENFHFRALPGGAMMYYTLPADDEVFGIQVRYKDAQGIDVVKQGGYAGDSLLINGFNEARQGVTARISLVDRHDNESESIDVTFDTKESSSYAVFNEMKVESYWSGFQVKYGKSEESSGMINVYYLGKNPYTQLLDTLLLKSTPISKNGDTLEFIPQQMNEVNTVIVRTEDYRGYRVKQQVWEKIEAYAIKRMPLTENDYIDPNGITVKNEQEKIGPKYLFDGDTKGLQRYKAGNRIDLYTFLAGPGAPNKPFIFDLGEGGQFPAKIMIYGTLNTNLQWPNEFLTESSVYDIFQQDLSEKLPCEVTVYAGNDKDGDNWKEIGHFSQDRLSSNKERWSARCAGVDTKYESLQEIEAADPAYIELLFPCEINMEKYRYVKLVVNDLFGFYLYPEYTNKNPNKYLSIQEVEIYVKD